MIKADTPNLWEMRLTIGHVKTKAVVITALLWLARLVNVERNLDEPQIAEIAEDIINEYGYLKAEEIKYIFKQSMRKNKIFGRLDYNVVMGWIDEYDNHRTDLCIDLTEQQDSETDSRVSISEGAVSFEEYKAALTCRAEEGEGKAAELLSEINNPKESTMKLLTAEEKHQKELDFKQFYYNHYLKKNGKSHSKGSGRQ